MDKEIEIIDKGNAVHKLTVTPKRITIKLKQDSSKEERDNIIAKFTNIAKLELSGVTMAVRGRVNSPNETLSLYTDKGQREGIEFKVFDLSKY